MVANSNPSYDFNRLKAPMKEQAQMIVSALKYMVAYRDLPGGSSFSGLLDIVPLYESLSAEARQDVIQVLKEWLAGNDVKHIELAATMCSRTAIPDVKEALLALLNWEAITSNRWITSNIIQGLGNLRSADLLPLFREYARRIPEEDDRAICGVDAALAIAKLDLSLALSYLLGTLQRDQRCRNTAPNLFRGQGLLCLFMKGLLEIHGEPAVQPIAQTIAQGNREDRTFALQLLDGAIEEDNRILSLQETPQTRKVPPHSPPPFVVHLSNELDLLQRLRENLQKLRELPERPP